MKTRICMLIYFLVLTSTRSFAENLDDEITIESVDPQQPESIVYESPKPAEPEKVYFHEHFDDPVLFQKKWIRSETKKDNIDEDIAKYDGVWQLEQSQKDALTGDMGLVLKSKAKHAAIASPLSRPFRFDLKPLIVQYEVQFQDGQECGGAYIKLLSDLPESRNLKQFQDKTPYTIMFGPDKCGNDHKLHFIFKHKNPLNGTVEEKHCKKPEERIEEYFTDKLPHLYTLILRPDNSFETWLDKKVVNSGSLLEDFAPPVNPPEEIDDPEDRKPENWDERQKIADPDAVKPDDWDEDAPAQIVDESASMPDGWLENEPTHVPDGSAKKPEDWDEEMDGSWEPPLVENELCKSAPGCGTWEPPLINNPEFKGKWKAPMIDNPNYMGKWRPKKIANPEYFEDKQPFRMHSVFAVGFELWSMSKDILFDNIIITDDIVIAEKWAADTFDKKRQKIASESNSFWNRLMRRINYNPKAWIVYLIYCSIPLLGYVWYLYSCVLEESLLEKLANVTNEYPLLWGLYIVILGVPIAFILYLCCSPGSSASQLKEKEELNKAAEKKKTDDLTEDVINEENDEIDEGEEGENEDVEDEEEEEEEPKVEESEKAAGEGTRKRKVRKD